jgi:hypothetical protein
MKAKLILAGILVTALTTPACAEDDEVCNGTDDNSDGTVDEGCTPLLTLDKDRFWLKESDGSYVTERNAEEITAEQFLDEWATTYATTGPNQQVLTIGPEYVSQSTMGLEDDTWIQMWPFWLKYRGLDTHPLEPCVSQNVEHVHLEFAWRPNPPNAELIAKFHVGYFIDTDHKSCVVIHEQRNGQDQRLCITYCGQKPPDVLPAIRDFIQDAFAQRQTPVTIYAAGLAATLVVGIGVILAPAGL